jgi:hypothetical protein
MGNMIQVEYDVSSANKAYKHCLSEKNCKPSYLYKKKCETDCENELKDKWFNVEEHECK